MSSDRISKPMSPVRYHVSMPSPQSHELVVTMKIPAFADPTEVRIGMPAWAPGSYMVRDFARHVYDLEVRDERGRPLPLTRLDKQRWEIEAAGAAVTVSYRVFAFEESVRTSLFDDQHAFWNGSSLFFYVEDELDRACEVEVSPRAGWRVSTALPPVARKKHTFLAASYDELADSPFEVGTHDLHTFRVGRTDFEVAIFGRTNADVERLLGDLRRVVAATGRLFGGFPFTRYLFIIHNLGARGGGLEHANSCTLDIAGLGFEDDKAYQRFAELAAHEFFHAWNVKRIHDRVLGPFDYERENYTRLLWFHEGFTEYMESIVLLRAGVIDGQTYLDDLAEEWPRYVSRPGRNTTPLSELSFEAWTKLYKPADNHTNRSVSYYEKGKWVAVILEVLLREATRGRQGVEDLFVSLWENFGQKNRGLDEEDIREAIASIAGQPFDDYFARYIHGTEELPVPAMLEKAGVSLTTLAPWEGDGADKVKRDRARAYLGVTWAPSGERATIRNVVPDSPAWQAGLTYGDEVIAVGGVRVNLSTVGKRVADHPPGSEVKLHFFRKDALRVARVVIGETPERRYEMVPSPRPIRGARAIRRAWLGL
ncbi:MAG TPA: PDZ domain-containing protein [Polyangia bacterium]